MNSTLDQISEIIMGQAPPSSSYNKNKIGTPFIKVTEFGDDYPSTVYWTTKPKSMAKKNDVLVCVVGSIGKINMGIDCAIGRSVASIRPNNDILESRFLFYFLLHSIQKLKNLQQGTTQGVISKKMLETTSIPIPPLNEQKKIIEKIEIIFSKIDLVKRLLECTKLQLEQYKQSFLKSIFEGSIVIKSEKSTIGEISEKIFKGIFDLSPNNYIQNGIPLLRISDISRGELKLSNCKYISKKINEINKRTIVTSGDIILAKVGATAGSPEKIAIIPTGSKEMNINQNLMGIKLKKDLCISKFVYHWLRYRKNMNKLLSKSKTTTFKSLRNSDLSQLSIFIPSLEEQKQIISQIENGFSLIKNSQNTMTSILPILDTMKMGVLKQAFEGKLIPQNSNDKPVSELLKQIKN